MRVVNDLQIFHCCFHFLKRKNEDVRLYDLHKTGLSNLTVPLFKSNTLVH